MAVDFQPFRSTETPTSPHQQVAGDGLPQLGGQAQGLDVDALVVAEASVGKSITMKRFATRARGRSTRIEKPFSRLRVVVREQEEA